MTAKSRERNVLLAGSAVSNLGDGISASALAWVLADTGATPFVVSAAGAALSLPVILLATYAGNLADTNSRRTLTVGSLAFRSIVLILIAFTVITFAEGTLLFYVTLVALIGLFGIFELLGDTALTAAIPSIVRRELLAKTHGQLYALRSTFQTVIGIPLGGAIIALAGAAVAFLTDAITFIAVAALFYLLISSWGGQGHGQSADDESEEHPIPRSSAFRFVLERPALRLLVIPWAVASNMAVAALYQLPLIVSLATDDMNSFVFAAVFSASGVGAIVGGALVGRLVKEASDNTTAKRDRSFIAAFMAVGGLALVLCGAFGSRVVILAPGLFLAGFAQAIWVPIIQARVQSIVPDSAQGRLAASVYVYAMGPAPFVALIAGALLSIADLPVGYVFVAAGLAAFGAGVFLNSRTAV